MPDDGVTDAARAIVAGALGLAPRDVGPAASPADLPGWDSLAHLRIVLAIEAARGRSMTGEEIAGLWDVGSVAAALERPET